MKGKDLGAREAIKRVILDEEAEDEYVRLKNAVMIKKKLSSKPLKKVLKLAVKSKIFKKNLVGGLIPVLVAQFVGVHYLMHQRKKQWKQAGIAKEYEFGTTVVASIITLIFDTSLAGKFNRKTVLKCSLMGIASCLMCLIFVKTYFWTSEVSVLVFIELYLIFYSCGLAGIPLLINTEVYNDMYVAIGGAAAAIANKVASFMATIYLLPDGEESEKKESDEKESVEKIFVMFIVISIFGIFLISKFVPETKLADRQRKRRVYPIPKGGTKSKTSHPFFYNGPLKVSIM